MKDKIYTPKPGETFKMITAKIKENSGINPQPVKSSRLKKLKTGKFKNSDLKYLVRGLKFLNYAFDTSLSSILSSLTVTNKDLTSAQVKALASFHLLKAPIETGLKLMRDQISEKYTLEQRQFYQDEISNIIQDSRDGMITKKMVHYETRRKRRKNSY